MKFPKQIICEGGEVTIAIARYLENNGVGLDYNLKRNGIDPMTDYFFRPGEENIIRVDDAHASWDAQRKSSGKGFKTLREFVASIQPPRWKIGCRTVVVDGGSLLIQEDNISVSKSTLEEMLKALK
jgi:hypothetical protein